MKKPIIFLFAIAILAMLYLTVYKNDTNVATKEQAVSLIKKTYPAFEDYPSDNLPPKRIEVISAREGWRVGMYMEGSGLPGILRATCFLVTKTGTVTEVGFFSGEGPAKSINLSTCTPKE